MACVNNQIAPITTKDWMAPAGWRPPNEKDESTRSYVYFCTIYYSTCLIVSNSTTKFKQKSIVGYTQKTKQPIPVTKEGIKEHFLAIITTCDLVSNFLLANS